MYKFILLASLMLIVSSPVYATDPMIPDPTLTPGAVNDPPTPLAELCTPGHTKITRHVSHGLKNQVFREYGYDPKTIRKGEFEIDHLSSLEIDGTNGIKNLWPQSYLTQPFNAHRKDVLEDTLHRLVCHHELDLATAQHAITSDWIAAYHQYVGQTP
jgi:hypothetical protein